MRTITANILLKIIFAYRVTRAAFPVPVGCRFFPSCSVYAEEAIRKYGAGRGALLGLKRLFRCHPAHPGGLDVVP